jgi:hypothetical protein
MGEDNREWMEGALAEVLEWQWRGPAVQGGEEDRRPEKPREDHRLLGHPRRMQSTFAISASNNRNIHLKQLKHLKYWLATCLKNVQKHLKHSIAARP